MAEKELCCICRRDIEKVGWSVNSKSNEICIECEHDLVNTFGHESVKKITKNLKYYERNIEGEE